HPAGAFLLYCGFLGTGLAHQFNCPKEACTDTPPLLILKCCFSGTPPTVQFPSKWTLPWLPGIELQADGYECDFYQKQ
ncbi:MAG: hypothetical protein J6N22_00760, partial [Schwartzia sp.]|nr:hypothetical protein [Schwartzia sp. (in: firmicutes)]